MGGEPHHALCRRCRRTLLSGRLLRNCWTTLGSGVTTKKTAWTLAPEMWIPATPGLTRRSGNSTILDSSGGCIVAHRCSAWLVDTFHWQASFGGARKGRTLWQISQAFFPCRHSQSVITSSAHRNAVTGGWQKEKAEPAAVKRESRGASGLRPSADGKASRESRNGSSHLPPSPLGLSAASTASSWAGLSRLHALLAIL